jgi:Carboxypeptidase regulatory-like domain
MNRLHVCLAVCVCTAAWLAGCGDGKSPVQPSADPYASLFPAFALSGYVVDTAYRPIAGSRVEIVAGPRTGTVEITDEDGKFTMEGIFTNPVTVRASKDGYQPETRIVPPPRVPVTRLVEGGMWQVQLYLAPAGPLPDLAGTYTMTITADNTCTNFPAEARTRHYTATVVPGDRPGSFRGTLSDARFAQVVPCPPVPGLSCMHNNIGMGNAGDYTWVGFSIIEQLGEHTYLVVSAGAGGSIGPAGGAAPLEGFLQYCETEPTQVDQGLSMCPADIYAPCESGRHQLTLAPR